MEEKANDLLKRLEELINEVRPGWIFPKDGQRGLFKAQVQKLNRITIPKTERAFLDINEGDWVQVLIQKIQPP